MKIQKGSPNWVARAIRNKDQHTDRPRTFARKQRRNKK
jgi:hypothetical protein